ncbi:hypothetical protein RCL_jg4020.t1 [Rhizophagus clarus]|uniref:Uncharacterized protein n=1 Tax=Rhizophagus clarus TaxID=94130 RepID=A0A8H3QBD7_9GLOM|nr:hypothetical protein RCL_jg4020.t1 [Rhizophagus clarus]
MDERFSKELHLFYEMEEDSVFVGKVFGVVTDAFKLPMAIYDKVTKLKEFRVYWMRHKTDSTLADIVKEREIKRQGH